MRSLRSPNAGSDGLGAHPGFRFKTCMTPCRLHRVLRYASATGATA